MADHGPTTATPAHDAEPHNWSVTRLYGPSRLRGNIHNDRGERFAHGTRVLTSWLQSGEPAEGAIIKTKNTRYLLVGPGLEDEYV